MALNNTNENAAIETDSTEEKANETAVTPTMEQCDVCYQNIRIKPI